MFRFDAQHYKRMRQELSRRRELLAALTPLPDANYAVDENWARFYPYAVAGGRGETVELELRLDNHTAVAQEFRVGWNMPEGWRLVESEGRVRVAANQTGAVKLRVAALEGAPPGIVTADIWFAGFEFRRWTEAMLTSGTDVRRRRRNRRRRRCARTSGELR